MGVRYNGWGSYVDRPAPSGIALTVPDAGEAVVGPCGVLGGRQRSAKWANFEPLCRRHGQLEAPNLSCAALRPGAYCHKAGAGRSD